MSLDRIDGETDIQYRSRLVDMPTADLDQGSLALLAAKIVALSPTSTQISVSFQGK